MSLGAARMLGWLVIAHALSHAVLPLRGSLAPGLLIDDWMPAVLYTIAMIGFTAAGLGILGLRPLDRAISPVLVVSAALSLVAIVRFGDPRLAFGAACDVALLITGLWRAAAGWPAHPRHGRTWHGLALAGGFAFLAYVAVAAALFPWHRSWGSTRAELLMALPGDDVHRNPALELQHAVTIDAPPNQVWPWLSEFSAGERVLATEIERAMVIERRGAFVLVPDGRDRTRFIVRASFKSQNIPVWGAAVDFAALELPHFIVQRHMMLTIKELAERHGGKQAAE